MPSLNRVWLIGHIGHTPEIKYVGDDKKAVLKLTLATTEKYGDKKTTTWHNIVLWGKLAESAGKYMTKGMCVFIEGRIDNRSYEKDGVKKYISEVVASGWQFAEAKAKEESASHDPQPQEEDDSDLPF
jgi:single-strand DNA-binding protein